MFELDVLFSQNSVLLTLEVSGLIVVIFIAVGVLLQDLFQQPLF